MSEVFAPPAPLQTAVLFLVFNRPDTTKQVFEAIRQARPPRLYVAADGARLNREGEAARVAQVRQIATAVDWPCEVKTLFREKNLGCKMAVSGGIDWFFQNEKCGIILEDDCLPSANFFEFCDDMLGFYEHDKRVYSVAGSNFGSGTDNFGHTFSSYSLMWGWATWADRWKSYDLNPKDHRNIICKKWWKRPVALLYWLLVYRNLSAQKIDTWDYQWILAVWRHYALSCRPSHNLVANVGFGIDATHTFFENDPVAKMQYYDGTKNFKNRLHKIKPDRSIEFDDERVWAKLNIRSVLLMMFPWLQSVKKMLNSNR